MRYNTFLEVEKGYSVELWYYLLHPNPIFWENLICFSETMDMFDFNECRKSFLCGQQRKRKNWNEQERMGYISGYRVQKGTIIYIISTKIPNFSAFCKKKERLRHGHFILCGYVDYNQILENAGRWGESTEKKYKKTHVYFLFSHEYILINLNN